MLASDRARGSFNPFSRAIRVDDGLLNAGVLSGFLYGANFADMDAGVENVRWLLLECLRLCSCSVLTIFCNFERM